MSFVLVAVNLLPQLENLKGSIIFVSADFDWIVRELDDGKAGLWFRGKLEATGWPGDVMRAVQAAGLPPAQPMPDAEFRDSQPRLSPTS